MAEEFLEPIYKEAELCCEIRKAVGYARAHRKVQEEAAEKVLLPKLEELCRKYLSQNRVKGEELQQHLQAIQKIFDPIVTGDILERRILPLIEEYMEQYGPIRTENEEGDYLFESSVSGFLTIKDLKDNRYFHSAIDPMWEAWKAAEYIYNPEKTQYALRGCGLGYLIYQLYKYSQGTIVIHVFEKDARMVEYARRYGVLDWVPEENLHIVAEEDPIPFLQSSLQEDVGMYFFMPEFFGEKEDIAPILEELVVQTTTLTSKKKTIEINYWSNIRQNCKTISEFDSSGLNKDVIVVAGGPSVDDNMEFLRENQGKKTLIAVGTVLRKLIQADIAVDLVVLLESAPIVYQQIKGLEECKVPMLLDTGTYWKVAKYYQGDKYLVPTANTEGIIGWPQGFYESAWATGGTVTDLALAAAIRFEAEKIYLVGVDMAYPGGVSHAKGTAQRSEVSTEGLMPVEGVGGRTVYTDGIFNTYRQQIEETIASMPRIEWYNMSRGARLAGTIEPDNL